ncbi:MAG TPA: prenyltransferase/squalene oxidase repeat-containing protein [Chthoniobacter sp.]
MKSRFLLYVGFFAVATLLAIPSASAADAALRGKVGDAIDRGLAYLAKQQTPQGYWSSADIPGLSGLCVQAFLGAPDGRHRKDDAVLHGLAFVRGNHRSDGGIYARRMGIYNTSICLVTLLQANDPGDAATIEAARRYLVGGQTQNSATPANDGGFGYETGSSGRETRPDLDNTVFAMEALRLYHQVHGSKEANNAQPDLNWQAALDFVSRCQHMPKETAAAKGAPAPDQGGFTYTPSGTNEHGPDEESASRVYGTMTYAGVLSFIYADLKKDDPRVVAALDWISRNYTLEENPGQGAAGLYYYYDTMAKGLTAAGIGELPVKGGSKVNWRAGLAEKLISLQKPDGSWSSENGRWMEKDPNLVTTYCVLALNLLHGGL